MLRVVISFVIVGCFATSAAADPSVRLSTVSPDGQFAVTIPVRPKIIDDSDWPKNTIIEVATNRVVAELPTETVFQGDIARAIGARWLPDGSALIWYVVSHSSDDVLDIVRFANGAATSQTDLRAPITRELVSHGMHADNLNSLEIRPVMSMAGTALGATAHDVGVGDDIDEPAFPLRAELKVLFSRAISGRRYKTLECMTSVVITRDGKLIFSKIDSHVEIIDDDDEVP